MHHITNSCLGHQDKSISGIVKVSFLQKCKHHQISHILINSAFQYGSFLCFLPPKRHKSTHTIVQASLELFSFAGMLLCRGVTACALPSPGTAGLLWLVWGPVQPSAALQQYLFSHSSPRTRKTHTHSAYPHPSPLSPLQCIARFL